MTKARNKREEWLRRIEAANARRTSTKCFVCGTPKKNLHSGKADHDIKGAKSYEGARAGDWAHSACQEIANYSVNICPGASKVTRGEIVHLVSECLAKDSAGKYVMPPSWRGHTRTWARQWLHDACRLAKRLDGLVA